MSPEVVFGKKVESQSGIVHRSEGDRDFYILSILFSVTELVLMHFSTY